MEGLIKEGTKGEGNKKRNRKDGRIGGQMKGGRKEELRKDGMHKGRKEGRSKTEEIMQSGRTEE